MPKKVDLIVNNGLTVAEIKIPDFETFNMFWRPFRHKDSPQSGVIVRTGGVAVKPMILSGDHIITYFTASKMKRDPS